MIPIPIQNRDPNIYYPSVASILFENSAKNIQLEFYDNESATGSNPDFQLVLKGEEKPPIAFGHFDRLGFEISKFNLDDEKAKNFLANLPWKMKKNGILYGTSTVSVAIKLEGINLENPLTINPLVLENCKSNNLEEVKRLTLLWHKNVVVLDTPSSVDGNASALMAVVSGNLELVDFILKIGGKMNIKNKEGKEGILLCSSLGHLEILKFLMNGKDSSTVGNNGISDLNGCSHLILAAMHNHFPIVQFLVKDIGVTNVNQQDKAGKTALIHACEKGFHLIASYLIDIGANRKLVDNDKNNAMHYASTKMEQEGMYVVIDKLRS